MNMGNGLNLPLIVPVVHCAAVFSMFVVLFLLFYVKTTLVDLSVASFVLSSFLSTVLSV